MKINTPVVIVGGSLNALGVVRSFSIADLPIIVIESNKQCVARWSQFCRFEQVASLEGLPLVNKLKELAGRFKEPAVVIATDDRAVATLAEFREQIEQHFILPLPSTECIRVLFDKLNFHEFAEKNNLSVPRSVIINSINDFQLLENITMPVVIKPANKSKVLNESLGYAVRVSKLDEAKKVAQTLLQNSNGMIVQEWIDGPDAQIFFSLFSCNSQGEIIGMFHGRKVISDPPNIGPTAMCVSANATDAKELEVLTRQFLSVVNYRGLGSVEYKRDTRNGKLFIIEPTVGRTDWQEEIATLNGVNLPLMTYQSELGITVSQHRTANSQVAWRSSFKYKPAKDKWWDEIDVYDGYFRLNDPIPGLYHYMHEEFIKRISNFIRRTFLKNYKEEISSGYSKHHN